MRWSSFAGSLVVVLLACSIDSRTTTTSEGAVADGVGAGNGVPIIAGSGGAAAAPGAIAPRDGRAEAEAGDPIPLDEAMPAREPAGNSGNGGASGELSRCAGSDCVPFGGECEGETCVFKCTDESVVCNQEEVECPDGIACRVECLAPGS